MNKSLKGIMSLVLCLFMIWGNCCLTNAKELPEDLLATESEPCVDQITFMDADNEYTLVREIRDDGINVYLYKGNSCVEKISNNTIEKEDLFLASKVSYGAWNTAEYTYNSQKLSVATMASIMASKCPYAPLSLLIQAASIYIAGGYDYYTIKVRVRTGYDGKFVYGQEEYTLYGRNSRNGKKHLIWGPQLYSQKRRDR